MFQNILRKLEPRLIRLYHRVSEPSPPNLRGDRDIEWSFIAANIGLGPGKALDLGPGPSSYLGLIAAQAGYKVTSLDLSPVSWFYCHLNLQFRQGDILKIDFSEQSFNLIINCSFVEHVGLSGRYGVKEKRLDGDIEAMAKLKELLKSEGRMLLTIPVGQDAIFSPLHRIYGKERLPKLLENFIVEKEEYWIKNNLNQWILTDRLAALEKITNKTFYGLGCFILRPKAR